MRIFKSATFTYLYVVLLASCASCARHYLKELLYEIHSNTTNSSTSDVYPDKVSGETMFTSRWSTQKSTTKESPMNCTLSTTANSYTSLRNLLLKDPAFVYLRLNFLDRNLESSETAYLNDTPSVVDPLTWSWAREGKGYLLRSLSPDFLYLSFGTLEPAVYHLPLDISTEACETFLDGSDTWKLTMLSDLIIDLFQTVFDENNQHDQEFKVCQEFFSPATSNKIRSTFVSVLINLHVFLYLPSVTTVQCWSTSNERPELTEHKGFLWLLIMYYTILGLGTMFFPLLLGYLSHDHPPLTDKNCGGNKQLKKRLTRDTHLPVGIKYVLISWKDHLRKMYIFRRSFIYVLLVGLSYLQASILYIHDERYVIRVQSAFRFAIHENVRLIATLVLHAFVVINVALLTIWIYRTRGKEGQALLEDPKLRNRLLGAPLVPDTNDQMKTKKFLIPEAKTKSWPKSFYHYMMQRMILCISPHIVWEWLWEETSFGKFVSHGDPWVLILKVPGSVLFALLLATVYNPCIYVIGMLVKYGTRPFYKRLGKRLKLGNPSDPTPEDDCTGIRGDSVSINDEKTDLLTKDGSASYALEVCRGLLCVPIVVVILLYLAPFLLGVIRLVAGLATLFASVFEFTFTGVLVNINDLDPTLFLYFATAAYSAMSITEFYNTYYNLNVVIIEQARNLDEEIISDEALTRSSSTINPSGDRRTSTATCTESRPFEKIVISESESKTSHQITSKTPPSSTNKTTGDRRTHLANKMESVPCDTPEFTSKKKTTDNATISEHLFWYVVDFCMPLRLQFCSKLIKFLILVSVALVGIEVLKEVNLLDQLSDSTNLTFAIIIPVAIPLIEFTIKSKSSEEIRQRALERNVVECLKEYKRYYNITLLTKEPFELLPKTNGINSSNRPNAISNPSGNRAGINNATKQSQA